MSRRLTKQQQRILEARRQEQLNADPSKNIFEGRVIAQHGQHVTLEDRDLNLHKASVRQSLGSIVCGDFIYYALEQNAPVVTTRLPRINVFSRLAFGGKERILAANIDQLFIVICPTPEPSPSLIDRYLIATEYLEIPTAFIVNKKDEIQSPEQFAFLQDYEALGLPVEYTSIFDPESIKALQKILRGKTSILVGQSGVGKSSLTNALIPELELQTQKINASTGLGNHTTSTTTLYHLPEEESYLIDSPGVRSFNIEHLPLEAIDEGFPDVAPLTQQCKFSNCRHLQDPHCAVQAAVEAGTLSTRRVESYMQIKSSVEAMQKRLKKR